MQVAVLVRLIISLRMQAFYLVACTSLACGASVFALLYRSFRQNFGGGDAALMARLTAQQAEERAATANLRFAAQAPSQGSPPPNGA